MATKVVLKEPARCKFLNSPFYKGTLIWDDLDYNVQRAETLKEFARQIKHDYLVHVNYWSKACLTSLYNIKDVEL